MCEFIHLKRNSGNSEEQDKPDSVWSNPSKIGQRRADFWERKKPGKPHGSGLFEHF